MYQKTRISVHALSEFVFCPRAGLLSFESVPEDPGHDLGAQRLDYAPNYLKIKLQKEFLKLLGLAVLLLFTAVAAIGFCWYSESPFRILGGFAIIYAFFNITPPVFIDLCRVSFVLLKSTVASAREPDMQTPDLERIGWWQLVSAGFDVTVSEKLTDPDCDLGGEPWRLMVKGRTVVPVFLRRSERTEEVRLQHQIRMTAYCHLLELTGSNSPFGVILDYGTEKCWIVKPTPVTWSQTLSALKRFRKVIQKATDEKSLPAEPNRGSDLSWLPLGLSDNSTSDRPAHYV